MHARVVASEDGESINVGTVAELERVLCLASDEVRKRGVLNVIYLEAANGNALSMVMGGDETVLGFIYGHGNPPYYESLGSMDDDEPRPDLLCLDEAPYRVRAPMCHPDGDRHQCCERVLPIG